MTTPSQPSKIPKPPPHPPKPRFVQGRDSPVGIGSHDQYCTSTTHPTGLSMEKGERRHRIVSDLDTTSFPDHSVDEVTKNGFIKLNTHDVSFVEGHVSGIERFTEDLQIAINAAWPTRRNSRYEKAHVLLLSWEDDNLGVYREMHRLEHVFSNLYRFNVESFKIPRKTAGKAATSRILSFLEADGPETLFVVYYAGHARLSHRSSEPPIWSATDQPDSPTLPSGGVQQLFEEAESDVLLLYDTCHSSHPAVNVAGQGVTEVIAACGFETEAPAVGPHSFTNALIQELEQAFAGPPISIAELHSRIIGSLKSWKPGLLRDSNGHVWTDENNRPRYECHKRRTPVHCFLTNETPYRSIMLAPLPSKLCHSAVAEMEQLSPPKPTASDPVDFSQSAETSDRSTHSTAPTTISNSSKGTRGPQVLLAVRLEDDYFLNDDKSEGAKKLQTWCDWLKAAPDGTKDISIQGIYKSFSTLVLISMPVVVWDILPDHAAYSFVGFLQSPNLAPPNMTEGQCVEAEERNHGNVEKKENERFKVQSRPVLSRSRSNATEAANTTIRKDRGEVDPIIVIDATGRRHIFPYHLCNTWATFYTLLKANFQGSDEIVKTVYQGHFQLRDQNGIIVLPQSWEHLVKPGCVLTLHKWQGPTAFKPPSPPPIRGPSPSLQPLNFRSIQSESVSRQRTLKRRPGFVLPKPPLHDNRPPTPEQSSDEEYINRSQEPLPTYTVRQGRSLIPSHRPTKLPSKSQQPPRVRSHSSPPLNTDRHSYPDTQRSKETKGYETWSGFSKPANKSEDIHLKSPVKPTRPRSLQEKYERDLPDPYAPRHSLSGASEKTIARLPAHKLRKEKGHLMLKTEFLGLTLRPSPMHLSTYSSKFYSNDTGNSAPCKV